MMISYRFISYSVKIWLVLALLVGDINNLATATTTTKPSLKPSLKPSYKPSFKPSVKSTRIPTSVPTARPTSHPTAHPTSRPTARPTARPTVRPTSRPSSHPTKSLHSSSSATAAQQGLSGGGIAGIVIAIVVLALIFFYIYRNHRNYLQKYIEIPITNLIQQGTQHLPGQKKQKKGYEGLYDDNDDEGDIEVNNHKKRNQEQKIFIYGQAYPEEEAVDEEETETENTAVKTTTKTKIKTEKGTINPMFLPQEQQQGEGITGTAAGADIIDDLNDLNDTTTTNSQGIVKAGYLLKKASSSSSKYQRRYFFIQRGQLYYTHKELPPIIITSSSTSARSTSPKRSGTTGGDITPSASSSSSSIQAVLVANLTISTIKSSATSPDTTSSTSSSSTAAATGNNSAYEFQIISPGSRGVGGKGGGIYTLQAENEAEYQAWIAIIQDQIAGGLAQQIALTTSNSSSSANSSSNKAVASSGGSGGSVAVNSNNNNANNSTYINHDYYMIPSSSLLTKLQAHNPTCIDCGSPNPEWCSINLLCMMCIDCSGVHRSLGTHISKIRSLRLDKWNRNLLTLLLTLGNESMNRIWEEKLHVLATAASSSSTPSTSSSSSEQNLTAIDGTGAREVDEGWELITTKYHKKRPKRVKNREEFIKEKYVQKAYLLRSNAPTTQQPTASSDTLTMTIQAIERGDCLQVMRALVHEQFEINQLLPYNQNNNNSKKKYTALMIACEKKQVLLIEMLLQWPGIDLQQVRNEPKQKNVYEIMSSLRQECVDSSGGAGELKKIDEVIFILQQATANKR